MSSDKECLTEEAVSKVGSLFLFSLFDVFLLTIVLYKYISCHSQHLY